LNDRRRAPRLALMASVLLVISMVALNALMAAHFMAFDLGFYRARWLENRVTGDTGMSIDDLSRAGRALLDYFTGTVDTPQLLFTIDGRRALYNDAELAHLKDVRSLFRMGLTLEQVLAAETIGIGLYLLKSGNKRALARSFLIAAGVSVAILLALAIPAKLDFAGWWTDFHLVTFSNDLWRLDPSTDWLIRMFPEEFFFSAVQRVGFYSSGISLAYGGLGLLIGHFPAHHRH